MKWSFIITEDLEKIRIKSVANWKSIYDPLHCKIIHEELSVSCCRLLYIILLKKPTSDNWNPLKKSRGYNDLALKLKWDQCRNLVKIHYDQYLFSFTTVCVYYV